MINRILLVTALIGMGLAMHLWVQDQRGFDRGCWGLAGQKEADAVCGSPEFEKVEIFSFRPASLGYVFFLAAGVTAMAKALGSERTRRISGVASFALSVGGIAVASYLLYVQAFRLHGFCPLCLVSAGLVAVLFTLSAIDFFMPRARGPEGRELGFVSTTVFTAAGLLAALVVAETAIPAGGVTQVPKTVAGTPSQKTGAQAGPTPGKIIFANWVHWGIPPLNSRTEVPVVVFMDPNCPHCAQLYVQVKDLAEEFDGRASIYVFPRRLWDYSALQTQAIEVARESGKYYQMWEAQFAHQKEGGMTAQELRNLAEEVGIPMKDYDERLTSALLTITIISQNAGMIGVNRTPTWFVDGSMPAPEDRSWEGIKKLIERAIATHRIDPKASREKESVSRAEVH